MDAHTVAAIRRQCPGLLARINDALADCPLPSDAAQACAGVADFVGAPLDLVTRSIGDRLRVLYLRTIVDEARVDRAVMRPLADAPDPPSAILAGDLFPVRTYRDAAAALLAGTAIVLRTGCSGGWAASVDKWPIRSISEPPAEIVAHGPHAGFIENLDTNLAQLRRGVPDPDLRIDRIAVWQRSGTQGAIAYVQGLANPQVLAEVRDKLGSIHPSFATDGSMLAQSLSPRSYLFPTVGRTERPDVAVAALLEGRVVLMVDGSPTAALIPQVFAHVLHVPSDYYTRAFSATMSRLLRMGGLLIALIASPLYVALTTVNLELIPTPLYVSIAQARLNVPFPTLAEILILEGLVEVIRQAGLRLPSGIGQPLAIVGAVVIGQSAVFAGLFSAPSVVVVSMAFIISFILPSPDMVLAIRALRYALIVVAAAFGMFGLVCALFLVLIYMCALESFGVPYLAPVTPLRPRGMQDTLVRLPLTGLQRAFTASRARRTGAGRAR